MIKCLLSYIRVKSAASRLGSPAATNVFETDRKITNGERWTKSTQLPVRNRVANMSHFPLEQSVLHHGTLKELASIAICKKIETGCATRLQLLSPFLERPSAFNVLGHIAMCCRVLPPQHSYS